MIEAIIFYEFRCENEINCFLSLLQTLEGRQMDRRTEKQSNGKLKVTNKSGQTRSDGQEVRRDPALKRITA